ncbi:unnamed protein product [Boreogadus saida]
MEADEKTLLGPVHGKFKFKPPDGTVDSNTVICNLCSKELSYHGSSSTLKYHLNAKRLEASSQVWGGSHSSQRGCGGLGPGPGLRPDPQGEASSQLGTGPVSQRCSPVWFHTVSAPNQRTEGVSENNDDKVVRQFELLL